VREQIFVGRDSKSGRSAFPFNLKGAADVEVGERADLSFLSFDLAIASDAGQMASDKRNHTRSKQNDRDLSHVKYAFSVMKRLRLLYNPGENLRRCFPQSTQPSRLRLVANAGPASAHKFPACSTRMSPSASRSDLSQDSPRAFSVRCPI